MKQAIKRRLTGLVLSAIVLAALALPAFAADIPAAPSGHAVLDQAGVLSEETINTVDGYNNALSSTGARKFEHRRLRPAGVQRMGHRR